MRSGSDNLVRCVGEDEAFHWWNQAPIGQARPQKAQKEQSMFEKSKVDTPARFWLNGRPFVG